MAGKTVKLTVRMSTEAAREITDEARKRGYGSPTAFLRSAIRKELATGEAVSDAEKRMAAGFERVSHDVFRVGRGQQALFALLDSLAKTLLTCIPEPPFDAKRQAIASGRERYELLIKTAGRAMVGESRAALRDLIENAAEIDHGAERR